MESKPPRKPRTPWQPLQPVLIRADMQHTLLRDCGYTIIPIVFHSVDNFCTLYMIGITQLTHHLKNR